jgi:hypothetical protein
MSTGRTKHKRAGVGNKVQLVDNIVLFHLLTFNYLEKE